MVSNIQIDSVLNQLVNFSGCYSLDQLDSIKPSPFKGISSYVLNTYESQYVFGGHWLAISFFKNLSLVEIFDSLGMPDLIPPRIKKTLSHFGKVEQNTKSLQDPISDCCGVYCISRIVSISRGQSLAKFLNNFGYDTKKNDILVNKVVSEYLQQ